jgi:hypothetical protein
MVNDIARPDTNGKAPKMEAVCQAAREALQAPWLRITTDDNLCSSVTVKGSLEPEEQWAGSIWHNSPYFMFMILPAKGARYHVEGERVTVQLQIGNGVSKFRKYTATPEKVILKLKTWIASH